jgi:protein-tyrosine phosphatase
VTHIINCAGRQIPNHWEPIGVAYLTFFWLDKDNQVSNQCHRLKLLIQLLLDPKNEASNAIFEFIEEALNATESVLVHSIRGQSRATCALAAYIMRKY